MFRLLLILCVTGSSVRAQNLPAFDWIRQISDTDPTGKTGPTSVAGIGTDAAGNVYIAGNAPALDQTGVDVYVTKLDPSGNVVYTTITGGGLNSGGGETNVATAMAVDAAGHVYVTGTTTSAAFPTTAGAFAPAPPNVPAGSAMGGSFVVKLNLDGSIGYATYFTNSNSSPAAVAVDSTGAVYLAGTSYGGLPTTSGAYQTAFSGQAITNCGGIGPCLLGPAANAFLSELDPAGAKLIFSTYIGSQNATATALALGPDNSAYLGGGQTFTSNGEALYHMNATGSALLTTQMLPGQISAIAVASNGNVYVTGGAAAPATFPATGGAFQTAEAPVPSLTYQFNGPYAYITEYDAGLDQVLASTLFGSQYGDATNAIAIDGSGNVLVGGSTSSLGLPTRTPFVNAFSNSGFLSQFSPDLSTLLFSTYLGDAQFSVNGVAASSDGAVVLAGAALQPNGSNAPTPQVWANKISTGGATPSFRIDGVYNAASLLDTPLSPGEIIVVRGAGFGSEARLLIDGAAVPVLAFDAQSITAVVPQTTGSNGSAAAVVEVQSGSALSNAVVVRAALTSPGLFSTDGSGFGQGYFLNQDGTVNSPANPANPGDKLTLLATGIGPVTFSGPFAVSQFLPAAFIDGFYADGVAAVMGPVAGLPGDVYQLTITLPTAADVAIANPDLKNYVFPPLVSVILKMNGVSSQQALALSITQ